MIKKNKILLSFVLLSGTILYSYKVQFSGIVPAPGAKQDHQLLYQVNFEKDPLPSFLSTQVTTAYGLQIVDRPVYEGKKAARFELRDSDPENKNGTRAEISFPRPDNTTNFERWYAFAVYFPRDNFETDSSDEVICQWHQGGKATPSLCIRTKANRVRLRIKPDVNGKEVIELGAIEKEVWQYYVVHAKHSAAPDGLVEIWRNGILLAHHKGANMYDPANGAFHAPNWKLGIYKADWNGASITTTHKRVLYFDCVSVGDEHATYADMMKAAKPGK
jgi:hypothetical protein